jgi:hypothetical protein
MIYKIEPTAKNSPRTYRARKIYEKPPKADKKKFVQFYFAERN